MPLQECGPRGLLRLLPALAFVLKEAGRPLSNRVSVALGEQMKRQIDARSQAPGRIEPVADFDIALPDEPLSPGKGVAKLPQELVPGS
jgi:hypothetical protein